MLMTADDMNQYSKDLDIQIELYKNSKSASFDALSKAVSLHNEIIGKDESMTSLQAALIEFLSTIKASRNQIAEMRNATSELPRMIKEINHAKRFMIEKIERFLYEIDATSATASNIVESIDQMI